VTSSGAVRFANETKLITCTRSAFSNPLYIPHSVWVDIAMDFVEGFPKVSGKMVVIVSPNTRTSSRCVIHIQHFVFLVYVYFVWLVIGLKVGSNGYHG
jgi:hypothetical protein